VIGGQFYDEDHRTCHIRCIIFGQLLQENLCGAVEADPLHNSATPQITGTVSYVSADTSRDQQTNAPYFTVKVVLSDEERRRLAGQQLVPGMPAEVFMQTRSRTMMSYLFKPIADQMRRAFVEQ
jgi:membrane fusion protein, type I secretion system